MKFLLLISTILVSLVIELNCVPISEFKNVIEYLNSFEYLTDIEKLELNEIVDNKEQVAHDRRFRRALKHLQENGHIQISGELDKNTLELMKKPRCGVGDKNLNVRRRKRYAFMSSKWHKNNLTWNYVPKKNDGLMKDEENIRRIIHEAFQVWEEDTVMRFKEERDAKDPDILITFEKPKHSDVDQYAFGPTTLGHAFQPGKGLGGDAHFNNEILWDFDVSFDSKPKEGKISFFAVALHELGHSLGLAHSKEEEAVMYEYYSRATSTLAEDDIRGMQYIYGTPNKKYKPRNKTESEESGPVWDTGPLKPFRCNMTYDAAAVLNGTFYVFSKQYMLSQTEDAMEIRSRFKELPEKLTHIDAIYQLQSGRIIIALDSYVYIFSHKKLDKQIPLEKIGISDGIDRIDAIFHWSDGKSKGTYMLSDKYYWTFDETTLHVTEGPKRITTLFRDAYEMETGFTGPDGELYFVRGNQSFLFNTNKRRLMRMMPEYSANRFMDCGIIEFSVRNDENELSDFIDENIDYDIEDVQEKDHGNSIQVIKLFVFVTVVVQLFILH